MKEAVAQDASARLAEDSSASNAIAGQASLTTESDVRVETWGPAALEQRRERTRDHLVRIAARRETWISRNKYYYELLSRLFRFLVEPQQKRSLGSLRYRESFGRRAASKG